MNGERISWSGTNQNCAKLIPSCFHIKPETMVIKKQLIIGYWKTELGPFRVFLTLSVQDSWEHNGELIRYNGRTVN